MRNAAASRVFSSASSGMAGSSASDAAVNLSLSVMSCISAAGNASHRRPLLQDRPFDDWRSRARELDMTRSAGALAAPAFVLCCQSESEPYRIARLSLNSRPGNTSAGRPRVEPLNCCVVQVAAWCVQADLGYSASGLTRPGSTWLVWCDLGCIQKRPARLWRCLWLAGLSFIP